MIKNNSNDLLLFSEVEEGLYEPVDPKDQSTDTDVDDCKDMMLEMHSFVNRQKSSYNWNNLK